MSDAFTDAIDAVHGEKQHHHNLSTWWALIRPILSLLLSPCWTVCDPFLSFFDEQSQPSNPTVTCTIICPPHHTAKVRLCLQQDSRSSPALLLDLPLHTCDFAAEVDRGLSRIALESPRARGGPQPPLLSAPAWAVYCGGRRIGYATRRHVAGEDTWLLETMRTVSAGAGVVPGRGGSDSGGFKYLRGRFERVVGSEDSESYHLIDPSGCVGHQELSIFFMRV